MNKAPLLSVKDLKKHFPIFSGVWRHQIGSIKAVDGISFDIFPGQVIGLVGESGSGKSTAGRAAIRLVEPTSGDVRYQGKSLLNLSHKEMISLRPEIQIVFQDPYASLNPRKTVRENIGEALLYHRKVHSPEEQLEKVVDVLGKVGLAPEAAARYPHEFSGGQQQRICIGRAIALDPKLIVCDEAVSALDVSIQAQILNLLVELKERLGLSYLFISHDLAVIRYLADEVLVMQAGRIVERGNAEAIFQQPSHPYTQSLLAAIPTPPAFKSRIQRM